MYDSGMESLQYVIKPNYKTAIKGNTYCQLPTKIFAVSNWMQSSVYVCVSERLLYVMTAAEAPIYTSSYHDLYAEKFTIITQRKIENWRILGFT